ncbi:type VII secretion integral membrane protein EccD [Mycolicibacterium helvum]|uniref:ESX-3 secretion system protein EccD3 n=1 Tax=Mycolicibacterium helvum TaxID=1534349 RepID=A0A7I7T8I7_9MYCO|nr:type VII secretion integral membrane protein EccD [Mycolicibacterium helvum]BBY65584.1 ESX-3 secretion system protein EccD3 [Mycolicibacterium helvum]
MTDVIAETDNTPVLPIVRVAVLSDTRIVDLALPAQLPLREILPALRRLLPSGGTEDLAADAPNPVSLAPIGGAPFSLDASLETVGVVDGDLLALQEVPAGPSALGIVEDVADAAVIFSASRMRPWGIGDIRAVARVAVVALIVAGTAVAVAHRIATGGLAGLYATSALAAVVILATLLVRAREERCAMELSIAALVPIAAALALAVPGRLGPAQVMLAAAGVAAWSLIGMINLDRGSTFFTAGAVVAAAVLVTGAVAQVWQLSLLTLGCGLLAVALLVTVAAAQLSALTARLPLPVIPAPGDPAPASPAIRVLEDLPRRVRISEAHQTGFIAGAVVLSIVGSLAVLAQPESVGVWACYAVIGTSAASLLRARVWDSAACKRWLLAQPFVVSVGLVVLYLVTGYQLAALVVLAVSAALTGAFVAVSASPSLAEPESYSLPVRRFVGLIAAAIDASLIPVLAYLVGLFAWVLDR